MSITSLFIFKWLEQASRRVVEINSGSLLWCFQKNIIIHKPWASFSCSLILEKLEAWIIHLHELKSPWLPLADIDKCGINFVLNAFSIMFNRWLKRLKRCDKWDFNHIFLLSWLGNYEHDPRPIMKGGAPRHKLTAVELITSISIRDCRQLSSATHQLHCCELLSDIDRMF